MIEKNILSVLIAKPEHYQTISNYFELFENNESQAIIELVKDVHKNNLNYDIQVLSNFILTRKYRITITRMNEYYDDYVTDANLPFHIEQLCLKALKKKLKNQNLAGMKTAMDIKICINDIFDKVKTPDEVEIEDGKKEYIQMVNNIEGNIIQPTIYSGIEHIDKSNNGYLLDNYIIIGGGESVGKTSFVLDLIKEQIMQDIPVALFECEMSRRMTYHLLACKVAGLNPKLVQNNLLEKKDKSLLTNALQKLYTKPLYVYDSTRNWEEIKNKSYVMKKKFGIQVFYHDYLQYFRLPDIPDQYQRLEIISAETKALAKELNTPIVQVSSLSRAGKGCEPENYHIKGNGDIEYNADIIGLLWTIDNSLMGDFGQRKLGFKISKNRFGEQCRKAFIFNCALRRFTETKEII